MKVKTKMKLSLKNIFKILIGFLIFGALLSGCIQRVPSGNVGVKVYLLGGDKGVDTEEKPVGRYWIGFNEELHIFPTFTQNTIWTEGDDDDQGSPNDESITFQTIEGLTVGADIGVSYHLDPNKVSSIFQKYRKGIDEITDVFLRNMVRDAFVSEASGLPMEKVYGVGKEELVKGVEDRVKAQVENIGIIIERVYLIGSLRLPDTVTAALDAKIAATQMAQQRMNEVAQAKAEADKEIEKARGEGQSRLIVAQAEAESIRIKGKALSENPQILQLSAIEKWDGILPKLTGSNSALPFIDVTKE